MVVSGQDAEVAACQRIVADTQTMTVYKPVRFLAAKSSLRRIDLCLRMDFLGFTVNCGPPTVDWFFSS